MVSRYGVTKDGAVGVTVGVGAMHCLLPHCGPHHLSPHAHNPNHNHIHHHNHHPPPSPSPHGHLSQLNHAQHQLTININHNHQHQSQQSQHQQAPPQYRIITASARSEVNFHVPGQNYGGQPGGQVGGGGGNVGVPGGRGPPPLGGIQNIGQSAAGIPPGGPTGAQQSQQQAPTPGGQPQQPQGPAPTTTPPVHTPSPQEMGKQAHLQAQPQQIPQGVYVTSQTRPASQGYYQPGPRQQAPRGLGHRGGQGGGGAQIVNMQGVGGGGGQPTAMYPHPSITVQPGAMYVQGQLPLHPSHGGPHQQSVYTMSSQMQPIQFPAGPPPRHQSHQGQPFYPSYQPILTQNVYGYVPNPTTQHAGYFFPPPGPQINLTRAGAGAVSGGAQHVGGPLAGAQGATVVPPGSLPQPSQQPQPLPPMALPLGQTDVYPGHNGGSQNAANSNANRKKQRRTKAIMDIVDPKTGKNISEEIYDDETATQSGDSSNRETPQPQNCGMEMIADFAARVAKAATEESESSSPAPASAPETPTSQNASQSLPNLKIQTNPGTDNNSQCNTDPATPTQSIPSVQSLSSQSLGSSSNAVQLDSCPIKMESKPLQLPVKEFQPRSEIKIPFEEPQPIPVVINKEIISSQPPTPACTPISEPEPKIVNPIPVVSQTSNIPVQVISSIVVDAPIPPLIATPNPVPSREAFPILSSKNSSNSPARRKSHNTNQPGNPLSELPPICKEPKERKTSEKSIGSSRGTTPTPQNPSEHHHPKPNGDTASEKHDSDVTAKNDQRPTDGKATQKQKTKRGHIKNRDLNRKGAEKEGTDMDAFVNAVPPAKPEAKQQEPVKQETKEPPLPPKDSNKEPIKEITKDIKEKDNVESRKEKELTPVSQIEKVIIPEVPKEIMPVQTPTTEKPPVVQNNKESFKEPSPMIEESSVPQDVCKVPVKAVVRDVVDHAKVNDEIELESAIVAQKNEENSKNSALRAPSEEQQPDTPVIGKQNESQPPNINDTTPKGPPSLKFTYNDDQWSPLNMDGKKVYDRDFLIKLQNEPNSRTKPLNLPDLEVVLKDNSRNRSSVDLRQFKDTNLNRHDSLFPGFVKSSQSARGPLPKRNSQQGKPKSNKGPVIHVTLSLREEVNLRKAENAWKPARLKPGDVTEEDTKTEDLYKRVRGVLNKLTPQKFSTLVNQVRSLQIDTQERLQGVIDLVFEKAIDEPSFSVAYALMCKELALMQVSGSDGSKTSKDDSSVNFRKLIITRCQMEFEKNTVDETSRAIKLKEIEATPDPEKKKELNAILMEEERRMRVKSVGNIRFIGELFKQGMLTTNIMHRCLRHLLQSIDEESLECLCKLLTTIGKDLESKTQDLSPYFNKMQDIVNRKVPGKVSSRVRFMLQDVIELRLHKWVPRRDDSNPKTMDQIQKEAETERLDVQLNNTPMNTPRKDDRNSDRKRNRGGGPPEEGGWSQPVRSSRQQYSVETSKLKNKPPPMDDLQLGSKNMFNIWSKNVSAQAPKTVTPNKFAMLDHISSEQDKRMPPTLSVSRSTGPRDYGRPDYKASYDGRNSRNGSQQLGSRSLSRDSSLHDSSRSQSMSMPPPQQHKLAAVPAPSLPSAPSKPPTMSEDQLIKKSANILEEYLSDTNIKNAALEVQETFDNSSLTKFVREAMNGVLERSATARKQVSQLLTHLISQNILPLSLYLAGLGEVLDTAEDLVIDIPKIWDYLAELILHPISEGVHPFSELKTTMAGLKSQGYGGKLLSELLMKLVPEKGPKWIKDRWDQFGLQWSDFLDEDRDDVNEFIKKYKLEFMAGGSNNSASSSGGQLSMEQIHERLCALMSKDKDNSFDNISSWISANVGSRVKEPQFIRVLMTAILEVSIEPYNNTWKLRVETFQNLQTLIQRYVDATESLELQCLFAIQAYIHKLEHPSGVLLQIIEKLWDENILSYDAFLAWECNKDPAEFEGKSVAMMTLTSFFTSLKEADDESSGDEA